MNTRPWEVRFWEKVDKSGECWLWTGAIVGGYGQFWDQGKHHYAYRFLWQQLNGPVPAGLQLDHLCRVRACVNPDHLEPVTPRENNMRGESFAAVNARKTHCPRGHEFAGDNLRLMPSGSRWCRTCSKADATERYRRRKAAS